MMTVEAHGDEKFQAAFDKAFEEKVVDFTANLNIALVGKVSSGKSSLLNAILERTRADPIAVVGAKSGVTTSVIPYRLDDRVLIVDCPGLDDVAAENSDVTQAFLSEIDLGIFVVTGSADATQRSNFDDLRRKSRDVIVVLNKIDEWDDLEDVAVNRVIAQWQEVLEAKQIFKTCTKGYDPDVRQSSPMVLRGVDAVRDEIVAFLKRQKKDILLLKNMKDKGKYSLSIIIGSLVAVAGESFIPGSAVYITATQVTSIVALAYLYTGKVVSKQSAIALLPAFIEESLGTNIFLWAKSFLPPTGFVDAAAAAAAVTITLAMLAAVRWMLESGRPLTDIKQLKLAFNVFRVAAAELKKVRLADLKDAKALLALLIRIIQGVVVPERSPG